MREQAFCWNNSFKRAALFLFLVYSLAGCDSLKLILYQVRLQKLIKRKISFKLTVNLLSSILLMPMKSVIELP
jgi:hypothetical protein